MYSSQRLVKLHSELRCPKRLYSSSPSVCLRACVCVCVCRQTCVRRLDVWRTAAVCNGDEKDDEEDLLVAVRHA